MSSFRFCFFLFLALPVISSCSHAPLENLQEDRSSSETYFKSIRRLTGGSVDLNPNGSSDGQWITFQRGNLCGQIFKIRTDGSELTPVTSARLWSQGPVFLLKGQRILFTGHFALDTPCTGSPIVRGDVYQEELGHRIDSSRSKDSEPQALTQIFTVKVDGSDPVPMEPGAPRAYQGDADVCSGEGEKVIFRSTRERGPKGESEMNFYSGVLDPTFGTFQNPIHLKLTEKFASLGRPTFSPDCQWIVWEGSLKKGPKGGHLPSAIWVSHADGSQARQLTRNGAVNFSPVFTPDGEWVVFSSNLGHPDHFRLYRVSLQGGDPQAITVGARFEGYPRFSVDGKKLFFSSTRESGNLSEVQLFEADWVIP